MREPALYVRAQYNKRLALASSAGTRRNEPELCMVVETVLGCAGTIRSAPALEGVSRYRQESAGTGRGEPAPARVRRHRTR